LRIDRINTRNYTTRDQFAASFFSNINHQTLFTHHPLHTPKENPNLELQFKNLKEKPQHNDDLFERKEENETLHKYSNILRFKST